MAEPLPVPGASEFIALTSFLKGLGSSVRPRLATPAQIDAATKTLEEGVRRNREGTVFEGFEGVGLGSFAKFALTQLSNVVPEESPAPEGDPKRRPAPRDPTRRPSPFPQPRRGPGRGPERRRPRVKLPLPKQIEIGARVIGAIFEKVREGQRPEERARRDRNREAKREAEQRELERRKKQILDRPEPEIETAPSPAPRTQPVPKVDPAFDPLPGVSPQPSRAPQRRPEPVVRPRTSPVPGFGVPGTLRAPLTLFSALSRPGTAPRIDFSPGPSASPPSPEISPPTAGPNVFGNIEIFPSIRPRPRQQRKRKCEKEKPKRPRKTCREGFFEETPTNTKFTTWRKVDCRTRKEKKTRKSKTAAAVEKVARRLPRIPRGVIPIDLPI